MPTASNEAETASAKLPVTVIGGYLGAGKTTLVNHLLRERGSRRLAVLVNDFGAIAIDADLIESTDGKVMQLAGGCVCCSFGSDLIGALMALSTMQPRPDQILVETSGVAIPGMVAQSVRLLPAVVLDAVLVLADASTLRARVADPYVGDTVLRQLRDADLLVLSKTDLIDADSVDPLAQWLSALAPQARVVPVGQSRLVAELVLQPPSDLPPADAAAADAEAGGDADMDAAMDADIDAASEADAALARLHRGARLQPPASEQQLFDSLSLQFDGLIDCAALALALADPQADLVRAKGLMRDQDGASRVVQLVGTRCTVEESDHPRPAAGRLVCIARKHRLNRAWLMAALVAAGAQGLRVADGPGA